MFTLKSSYKFILSSFIYSIPFLSFSASLSFSGNSLPVIETVPPNSTGLNFVYVVNGMDGLSINYISDSGNIEWYRYSNLGGGYAELIKDLISQGNEFTLPHPEGDMGYIIRENGKDFNFWIIDYSKNPFFIESLNVSVNNDCEITELEFLGNASSLNYYSINGRQETLSRDIQLSYSNLEWDRESLSYNEESQEKLLPSISGNITLIPPVYCNTYFVMEGDRFQEEWEMAKSYETTLYTPISVTVESSATQLNKESEDASNVINNGGDGLGGSAPCDISFESYVSDAVVHNEWQMSTDPEFEGITYRINQRDFDYSFTDEGTTYIRFIGSNSDGSCEAIGEVYTVNIGDSQLFIPNAFSPDGDGTNDVWKVSYRSLLEFKCWIFDKQGHQIYYFEDPDSGWDGTRKGKAVNSGVYFYVIQATGSDGKKYKKSGDINILKSKRYSGTGDGSVSE